MAEQVPRCDFEVGEPPGYWHSHRCGRPVKATITTKDGIEKGVCGIHKRQHDRWPVHSARFMAPGSGA